MAALSSSDAFMTFKNKLVLLYDRHSVTVFHSNQAELMNGNDALLNFTFP